MPETHDKIEPADGGEDEGLGVGEPGESEEDETLEVDMGAALDMDEDAVAEAANTSLDMEGFETGAGYDLEDVPDELGGEVEVEALEVTSSALDETDQDETETPSSAEPSEDSSPIEIVSAAESAEGEVDGSAGHADGGSPAVAEPARAKVGGKMRRVSREEMEQRKKRRAGARRVTIATSSLLGLGVGGLALGYWGVVEIPGITPLERSQFVPTLVVPPGPVPETAVMSHVLFVDAWREAETPLTWADALQERMPELLGFVTALTIDGDRRYALLVGPARGAVEATGLRDPLATALALLNPDPASWTVQEAPYSFLFGEYETLGEANGRVQELAGLSIPAFVLEVTYTAGNAAGNAARDAAGTGVLRVYGGAFSTEVEAAWMGQLLSENDLGDVPLTERRGRLPV